MKAIQKIFDFLASFEFLFILLVLIVIAMSIGTVLPQQSAPEDYIKFWGKVKTQEQQAAQQGMMAQAKEPEIDSERGERIYNRYRSLGLLNLYHSMWFLILSYLLCFNVFLCVIKRWTKMRLFAINIKRIKLPGWEKVKFPIPLSWKEDKPITLVETYFLLGERIRKAGFKLTKGEASLDATVPSTDGKRQPSMESVTIVAWKGFPQKPMSLIFHLSIIIALVFCGLGSLYAFETTIMLEKGVVADDWLNRGELASKTLQGELVGLPPSLSMSEPVANPLADTMKEVIAPSDAIQKIKSSDSTFIDKIKNAHYSMVSNPFTIDHFDRLILYPKFYKAELADFYSEYVEYKFKPSAKDWFPTVRFLNDSGDTLHEWVAESNYPAKFKGVQYHISDYLYKFQLLIESPDGSMVILPSESPDGRGFPGYYARKAYGWKNETIKLDQIGAELTVKSIYAGKLFKSERAKEWEDIEPYVDVNIKMLETPPVSPAVIPSEQGTITGNLSDQVSTGTGTSSTPDSSMNQGGMPSKPPEYVKLRTRGGYMKSGEAPLSVGSYKLYLGEINPIVEFGVRHDPGIAWFYFFGYLACIAMALKIYYPAYRLRISIDSQDKEHVTLSYNLTGWGLFSNVNAIRKNITLPKDIN